MFGSKSHQNRPIFRGKARDGHIPSKSVIRKKKKKAETNKYDVTDNCVKLPVYPDTPDNESSEMFIIDDNKLIRSLNSEQKDIEPDEPKISEYEFSVLREIKHVRKRIMNIQESIQLSPAMADPNIWKENCLNAVLNCVNEWRNIVAYHGNGQNQIILNDSRQKEDGHPTAVVDECSHTKVSPLDHDTKSDNNPINSLNEIEHDASTLRTDEDFCMNPNNEWSKETSRQIYGLIQMALQTGPLKASNPGYFKRCGALVAAMAKEFLDGCIGENAGEQLRFTPRQTEVLSKWIKDASKAVHANKEPSKYGLKIQTEGTKMSKKGKK
jgi:hypothetical protein